MIAKPSEIESHDCDSNLLIRMLADQLDVQQQIDVTTHLDGCSRCQRELETLAGEASWWEDTRDLLVDLTDHHTLSSLAPATSSMPQAEVRPSEADGEIASDPIAAGMPEPSSPESGLQAPRTQEHGEREHGTQERGTQERGTQEHWVAALLSPTNDDHSLGEIDGIPVDSVIGQGGMGVVLRGRDNDLHRNLAIKLLSPMLASCGAARQRFLREAQAAAAVVHPNIVPIYAVSADRKLPFLVMPFVGGGNLQQYLDDHGPLPIERVLSIGIQVAEGLSAAHLQGIIHRDIKPGNLMLDEGGFRVMLTDFGLARALDDATLTGSGMISGTPQYMSPEQASGMAVDSRTDLYSLGAVLYALATARPPIRGSATLEVLRRINESNIKPASEINETYPIWFDQLIAIFMHKDRSQRIQSADDAANLLRECLSHIRAPRQSSLPEQLQTSIPSWSVHRISLVVATVVLLVGLSLIALLPNRLKSNWTGWIGANSNVSSTNRSTPSTTSAGSVESTETIGQARQANVFSGPRFPSATRPSEDASSQMPWQDASLTDQLLELESELSALKADLGLPVSGPPQTDTEPIRER